MSVPSDRLQELIARKDGDEARRWCMTHGYGESWSIIDGALVIFNFEDPPRWLPSEADRDKDGNTTGYLTPSL